MTRTALATLCLALCACSDDAPAPGVRADVEVAPPGCAPDRCDIAGVCYDNLAPNPGNPCEACVVLVDRTRFTAWDGGTCDDDDACTAGDACRDGICQGSPTRCDDADPCTVDRCDTATGACTFTAAPEKCGQDPCLAEPDCDDDNPCTDDRCEPFIGCVSTPLEAPIGCDDGDACTLGETCQDGLCEPASVVACDDSDLCTIDLCDPVGGCRHVSIASLCADANPCTDERCEPDDGCVYPFNTVPCDDSNACTASDTCTGGACLGAPVSPDDGNPCTDDACDPLAGVLNVPNRLPCSDGDACTVGDTCQDATCRPGQAPLDCDDGNACSDDACEPATGCVHLNHTRACDDASLCTTGDTCEDGACVGARVDCDDGNACTTDACAAATGCTHTLIVSDPCRPTITVTHPPRGATLTETTQTLTATGRVTSGAGPITRLTVNGVETTVAPDGTWSATLTPDHGGNILEIEATDSFGTTRRRVQSFLWSRAYREPTTPRNGIVGQGVGLWLDKLAIDDGDRASPPNDLASILQIALRSFDIAALIPRPAANDVDATIEKYDVFINNLTYDPPTATLRPQAGGIHLTGRIANGRANIRAVRDGCQTTVFGACVSPLPSSISGTITWTALVIDADLDLSVVNNDIRVVVRQSSVQIQGLDVRIDGAFGWLAEFILDFFLDSLTTTIENQFNAQLGPVIGPLVEDGLAALAFQLALEIPKPSGGAVPIDLLTDWSSVACDADGCAMVLRAGAYADQKLTPYTNSGIPNRDACGNGTQAIVIPEARILELVIADDTLNQLLYAAWRGGLLEFPVPAEWLTGVDLAQYGITDLTLAVSGMLAPTASDCAGRGLEVLLGDVRVSASLTLFGQRVDVVIWASVFAGLELFLDGQELGIRLTEVKRAESEVQVLDPELISLEPVIAGLIEDQVLAGLVDQLGGDALGGFPLPEIDLSGAIPGLPQGTGIRIVPEALYRQGGNTITGGRLN